ncbi:MAG: endonuclease V [Aquificaceae bacterium]
MTREEFLKKQHECALRAFLEGSSEAELYGGIDLSFENPLRTPTRAFACMVVFDGKEEVSKVFAEGVVKEPYVPGLLAMRELELILKVFEKSEIKPQMILIDGHGQAHPRLCGIAMQVGQELDIPAIGVAKSPLVGEFKYPAPRRGAFEEIIYKSRVVGYVLRTKENVKPVFVSAGHRISHLGAIEVVLKLSRYRIPEPIRLAHLGLSKLR